MCPEYEHMSPFTNLLDTTTGTEVFSKTSQRGGACTTIRFSLDSLTRPGLSSNVTETVARRKRHSSGRREATIGATLVVET